MFQDKDLLNHIETSSSISTKSLIALEWNMNIATNILELGNYRYRPNNAESIYRTIPNTFVKETKTSSPAFYYGATDADVLVDGGFEDNDTPVFFSANKDKLKMLYSLEDCLKSFRPRSGINKATFLNGKFLHSPNMNMARRPRYYMADKKDPFKYWTSFRTESGIEYGVSNKTINGKHAIEDTAPFVVYKENVPANRLVIKMQTNVGDLNSGTYANNSESFSDPYFGESNQTTPEKWKIQVLKNNSWLDAISFSGQEKRKDGSSIIGSDGYVELSYGLIVPKIYSDIFNDCGELSSSTLIPEFGNKEGDAFLIIENSEQAGSYHIWYKEEWKTFVPNYSWQLKESEADSSASFVTELSNPTSYIYNGTKKYKEFEYISGIRIVVDTMKKFDSTFDLIEFSPRLAADLSDMVESFSINKSASDLGVSGMPVGQLLASTGDLSLFDFEDSFNPLNKNSIISKYVLNNIQVKIYEILKDSLNVNYYVPIKTMYSDGFPKVDNQSKKVGLTLRDLYLYFESQTAPEILMSNVSLSVAVSILLDSIGFSNYIFKRVDGESEIVIPYFFIPPDKSVAQILEDLALSTQTAMFFDEYNNFVMMSKDYMMPTKTQRPTDLTLYGSSDSENFEVIKNKNTKDKLSNIIEVNSQDNQVYNDGKISYTTRSMQRSVGTIREASLVDNEKSWIYKPVLLWEVQGTENTKSINSEVNDMSSYALAAIPLNSNLSSNPPSVSGGKVIDNIIDLGEAVYWVTRYNGYFYSNGEIIKYDAVEYNVAGSNDVWINSVQEYDKYFSSLPFNGKIYPTGRVRIYSEPNYEDVNGLSRLKNGSVAKHGRGQFGTPIVSHSAGIDPYWSNNDNLRGCNMESKYLFKKDQTLPTTSVGPAGINITDTLSSNVFAQKSSRNGIIKNMLSSKYISESDINSMTTTKVGAVQSSALVINGPGFKTTEPAADFISYVYKPLPNSFKHFGTRLRVIGKIDNNPQRGQTAVGATDLFVVPGTTADKDIKISGGSGGLGVLVNPETNNGYYFEIIALGATSLNTKERENVNNVIFYKIEQGPSNSTAVPITLYQGIANILVDDGKFSGKYRLSAEQNPTVYDLSVEYQDIGSRRKFFLYINGNLIATVFDEKPLPAYNNLALFVRGSSRVMFENVYALANNYSENTSFKLNTPISNAFGDGEINANESLRKYAMSGAVQSSYLSGISSSEPTKFSMYFDEFGTIMREAASFDFKYDIAYPALYATIAPTFNSIRGYVISGFKAGAYGAEFLVFNATDRILNLDETSGNYLRIQGVTFTQQSSNTYSVDDYFLKNSNLSDPQFEETGLITSVNKVARNYQDIKTSRMLYGKKDFSLDVPYIQSQDDAENLMSWLVNKITKPRKSIGLKIFANPMIQLGDIVSVDYVENGIEKVSPKESRFVVYNIEYAKTVSGPEMSIFLSEVV
ncbi:MAG: hypothetical protein AN484_01235 [Aphanizomenon flos-aquae WA102]|uniref:Uncharacterized protein n=1 Tax=Aphanizomenon flos-aquae WA102 TaxID=1710896 RepID=A0A1B7X8A7_APHFL|nr:MAG: hypothetical protein AN484_01235 [Aphanizomenon flos-aquae WA102]